MDYSLLLAIEKAPTELDYDSEVSLLDARASLNSDLLPDAEQMLLYKNKEKIATAMADKH